MIKSILIAAIALSAPGSTSEHLDVGEVMNQARLAAARMNWTTSGHHLRFSGEARVKGVVSEFELLFGPDGEFLFATEGPLANTTSWDGTTAWSRDVGAPSRSLAAESRGNSLLSQWVHSGYWTDSRAPLAVEVMESDSDEVLLHLSLEDSSSDAKLTLSKETWLPRELRQESAGYETLLRFEDYQELAGVPLAHHVSFQSSSVKGYIEIREGQVAAATEKARYSLAGSKATDTRFDADLPSTIEVQRVRSGHLLVQPSIDGAEPAWFILDTGAGQFCIDPKYADTLELPEFGEVPAVGVAGSVIASFRQGKSFALGPIEIADPVYVEIELSFLEQHFGVAVAGICGYDLFARSIFELDLETPSAAIHDPESFELGEDSWAPMTMESRLPCIECRFEGDHTGLFRIDTGDAGTVTFDSPTVRRFSMLENRELQEARIGGVGGSAKASRGTIDWFELGGTRVEAVDVIFAQHEKGMHSKGNVMGTLGSQLFRPFHILFDYQGQRIALLPRAD